MPTPRKSTRSPKAARTPDRVLAAVLGQPWAITPEGLELVLAVASRGTLVPEALERAAGRTLDNTYTVMVRDGIAIVPVSGPLLTRASLFDEISGASCYARIAYELSEAVASSEVRAIVLRFDSPGGQVAGCHEAAQLIADVRGTKPIIGYVEGNACSAAYWLAAACDEIVASPSAVLGCLGCQVAYLDDSKLMERVGLRDVIITSSQTPEKNRAPTDDLGLAAYQQLVDDLAGVFLDNVAALRGVDRARVDADFGRGAVMVGARAVTAGLADRLATYESLHAELAHGATLSRPAVPGATATAAPNSPATEAAMPPRKKSVAPTAAAAVTAAAFETNTDVRALVSRDVAIAEGDEGVIVDVRDGTFYAVQLGDDAATSSYLWLAEDEIEAVTAPAADAPPADNAAPADTPPAAAVNAVQRLVASVQAKERARITGILALSNRAPLATLLPFVADATCTPQDAAHRLLTGTAKGGRNTMLANLAADEAAIAASGGLSSTDPSQPAQTDAQRIIATTQQFNPRAVARTTRG